MNQSSTSLRRQFSYTTTSKKAAQYIIDHAGATEKTIEFLKEQHFLK